MKLTLVCVTAFAMLIGFSGCGSSSEKTDEGEAAQTTTAAEHSDHQDADDDGKESDMSAMEKMKAQLAKLSAEDAASAMKQHFCPVSDEMLGVMGPPIKVEVNGQEVWICCEGCKEKLLASPEEYLAKLQSE